MEQSLSATGHEPAQRNVRSFTHAFVLGNLATFVVYAIGTIFMLFIGPFTALAYGLYCVLSTVAMWRFVCIHCPHYGSVCPCGYSTMATTLFMRGDQALLPSRHRLIWVFVGPSWLIPPIAGVPLLLQEFSWVVVAILITFIMTAFAIAPSVSKMAGCCEYWRGCPTNQPTRQKRDAEMEVVIRK